MKSRLNDLINPRLYAVYIPSDCKALPTDAPFNTYTADNIVSYYKRYVDLMITVRMLNICLDNGRIEVMKMADFVDQLASDDFYVGDGLIVWTELGQEHYE